ncbi:exonuclease domain-containing protein [Microbacterium sp. ASV81]|uniref:Exonuclease domain-containing protein n=1 Tax=Microbacterium capsulatum TaxID=3041921 RepID=A0ABU0XFS9_9MICO|nr:exonuclease domain-containing protein [Microbacterium sp. ASV81]MDQ4213957.1 exonuclease domain-containing protein [Microbacterium sp. ASV81]
MALDFTAIDFETANSSPASACSVGLVRVRGGVVVAQTGWLIRPPAGHDEFQEWNVRIHGIEPHQVADAATWSEQLDRLCAFAGADVLVAHNAGFDLNVIRRACEATGDDCPPYQSLCSLAVARKVYDLASYKLPVAAEAAGFGAFPHHDALADARACAQIVIDAARRTGSASVFELADAVGVRLADPLVAAASAKVRAAA